MGCLFSIILSLSQCLENLYVKTTSVLQLLSWVRFTYAEVLSDFLNPWKYPHYKFCLSVQQNQEITPKKSRENVKHSFAFNIQLSKTTWVKISILHSTEENSFCEDWGSQKELVWGTATEAQKIFHS